MVWVRHQVSPQGGERAQANIPELILGLPRLCILIETFPTTTTSIWKGLQEAQEFTSYHLHEVLGKY